MDANPISVLSPPLAFVLMLLVAALFYRLLGRLSFHRASQPKGAGEPYACGENIPTHMIQPNYGQFLPFAFFFTVLHVVALTIATVPMLASASLGFALLYVLGAGVGLTILFRG